MKYKTIRKTLSLLTASALLTGSAAVTTVSTAMTAAADQAEEPAAESYEDSSDGGHAIEADGTDASYSGITVTKTGESEGDEADFYGENAAVFATNGAGLSIEGAEVTTDGTHANAIFSYGEGTTIRISDSVINTSGSCSGGLMVTGGGTLEADNLTIHTTGRSSAAIRSDRGGGTENVTGGTYTTDGTGSPVIYSTADVTVRDAELTSTASQGVVVEGKNSVALENVNLTADNTTKNSDKSDTYQAVMIYQSMSGDIFFVNNTVASISLTGAEIINEDEEGLFLRAAAAGWGNEGSNGGHVTLTADAQTLSGNILVDDISTLNLYLNSGSSYEGAVNTDGGTGDIFVSLTDDAVWTLTGDSYISALSCDENAIDLNGFTLYVSGEAYQEGTASEGEAIQVEITASEGMAGRPDAPPEGTENGGATPGNSTGRPGEGGMGKPDGRPGDGGMEKPNGKPGDGGMEKPNGKPGDGGMGKPDSTPAADSQEMLEEDVLTPPEGDMQGDGSAAETENSVQE